MRLLAALHFAFPLYLLIIPFPTMAWCCSVCVQTLQTLPPNVKNRSLAFLDSLNCAYHVSHPVALALLACPPSFSADGGGLPFWPAPGYVFSPAAAETPSSNSNVTVAQLASECSKQPACTGFSTRGILLHKDSGDVQPAQAPSSAASASCAGVYIKSNVTEGWNRPVDGLKVSTVFNSGPSWTVTCAKGSLAKGQGITRLVLPPPLVCLRLAYLEFQGVHMSPKTRGAAFECSSLLMCDTSSHVRRSRMIST